MKVIDKAIEYLHEHGWVQGRLKDDFGRVCLVGSLCAATCDLYDLGPWFGEAPAVVVCHEQFLRARDAVAVVLRERCDFDDGVEGWNDDIAEDVDEVIEVLKLAGEYLDSIDQ